LAKRAVYTQSSSAVCVLDFIVRTILSTRFSLLLYIQCTSLPQAAQATHLMLAFEPAGGYTDIPQSLRRLAVRRETYGCLPNLGAPPFCPPL